MMKLEKVEFTAFAMADLIKNSHYPKYNKWLRLHSAGQSRKTKSRQPFLKISTPTIYYPTLAGF